MIGIVIPAHNEEDWIENCLAHGRAWVHSRGLSAEQVGAVIVADACMDDTAIVAAKASALTVPVSARNVGAARPAGSEFMPGCAGRWLASTDADTLVSPDWLADQVALNADSVCATVERTGAKISWSARPRMYTGARRVARAPGGFADAPNRAFAERQQGLASAA